jgi:hypothetical protein
LPENTYEDGISFILRTLDSKSKSKELLRLEISFDSIKSMIASEQPSIYLNGNLNIVQKLDTATTMTAE